MTAAQTLKATKGQSATHLHFIGEQSGKIVDVKTIRNRRELGKELRELEFVDAVFAVNGTTITVR